MQDPDDIYRDDHDDDRADGSDTAQGISAGNNMGNHSHDIPDESHDIDEEMEKIGKDIDPEDPKPLGE